MKLILETIIKISLVIFLIFGICLALVKLAELNNKKPVIKPDLNGHIALQAVDAEILGIGTAKYNVFKGVENIGWWDHTTQSLRWRFIPAKTGPYQVNLNYALPDGIKTEFNVSLHDQNLTCTIHPTGGWDKWKDITLGNFNLTKNKTHTLTIRPIKTTGPIGIMNLCRLHLIPKMLVPKSNNIVKLN